MGDEGRRSLEDSGGGTLRAAMLLLLLPPPPPLIILKSAATNLPPHQTLPPRLSQTFPTPHNHHHRKPHGLHMLPLPLPIAAIRPLFEKILNNFQVPVWCELVKLY